LFTHVRFLSKRKQLSEATLSTIKKWVLCFDLFITGIYLANRSAEDVLRLSLSKPWWMVNIRDLDANTSLMWGIWTVGTAAWLMLHWHIDIRISHACSLEEEV
jgi:hypothetical protein